MIFYIFATYTFKGIEHKTILGTAFKLSSAAVKAAGGKAKALAKLKADVAHERLVKAFEAENRWGEKLESIEIVSSTHGKWIDGEYYAHEYNAFAPGRARRITYSNRFIQCEVQCMDKSKDVCDGIWDLDDPDSHRLESGTGDHFTPVQKLP